MSMRIRSGAAPDRGAALVLVGASMMLILGMVALAIDGGWAYDIRRGSQNAADNAALAAAWEDCNPANSPEDPLGEAISTAAAQGFDNTAANISVVPTPLGGGDWEVAITTDNQAFFGGATPFANDSTTVVSEATASCDLTTFLDGRALFAGASACHPVIELNMTGSNIQVDGGIFSNGSMTINGATQTLSGPNEYGDPNNSNTGSQYTGPLPQDYPIEVTYSQFHSGGTYTSDPNYFHHNGQINNNWMIDNGYAVATGGNSIRITQSGIYHSSNQIRLQNVTADPGVEFTLVSSGTIDLNGSNLSNLQGYVPVLTGGTVGLLMFSDHGSATSHENPPSGNCSGQDAIKISSATFTNIGGVIFAPHAPVQFSNSDVDLNGSVIAFLIKTSGSNIEISYQSDPAFDPEYEIELLR